jgi:hypothetical protein
VKNISARIYAQAKLLDIVQRRDRIAIVDALGALVQEHSAGGRGGCDGLIDFMEGLFSLHDRLFVQPHIRPNELGEWGIGYMPEDHAWSEKWGAWVDAEGAPLPWKEEHPGETWPPGELPGLPDLDVV